MADARAKPSRRPRPDAAFLKFRRSILADTGLSLVAHERGDEVCDWLTNGASSLTVTIVDGVMLASYSGPVDLSFLLMAQTFAEGTGRWQAKAVVVDFARAVIAFDGDALDKAFWYLSTSKKARPRALVAPAPHASMVKQFTLREAGKSAAIQRGFTDRGRAIAWANEWAQHSPLL